MNTPETSAVSGKRGCAGRMDDAVDGVGGPSAYGRPDRVVDCQGLSVKAAGPNHGCGIDGNNGDGSTEASDNNSTDDTAASDASYDEDDADASRLRLRRSRRQAVKLLNERLAPTRGLNV